MCSIIDPDIIVASLFNDKVNVREDCSEKVCVSLDECLKSQARSRAIMGAVKADADKKRFKAYFEQHKTLYKEIGDDVYELNYSSNNVEDISSEIMNTVGPGYPSFILRAFGF